MMLMNIIGIVGSTLLLTTSVSFGDDRFNQEALAAHNDYRRFHCTPPLTLSKELSATAQNWADTIAKTGQYRYSGRSGENLYKSPTYLTGVDVTRAWYNEKKDYNYNNPVFDVKTGHFTQVIWKKTRKVGFGVSRSPNGTTYIVANYDPAGNFVRQFKTNVLSSDTC